MPADTTTSRPYPLSPNAHPQDVRISRCTFRNNTVGPAATRCGGAVHIGIADDSYGSWTHYDIFDSLFEYNSYTGAASGGGALCVTNNEVQTTVRRSVFRGNTVSGPQTQGGAVSVRSCGNVRLLGCTFDRNRVYGDGSGGGAVSFVLGSFILINATVFTGNSAPGLGVTGAANTYAGALSVNQGNGVVLRLSTTVRMDWPARCTCTAALRSSCRRRSSPTTARWMAEVCRW
jgi:hypothetical protein